MEQNTLKILHLWHLSLYKLYMANVLAIPLIYTSFKNLFWSSTTPEKEIWIFSIPSVYPFNFSDENRAVKPKQ